MVGYLYEELPQQDVHLGRVLSKSPAAKLKVKVEGIKKEINFVRRFGRGFSMFFKTNQREARSLSTRMFKCQTRETSNHFRRKRPFQWLWCVFNVRRQQPKLKYLQFFEFLPKKPMQQKRRLFLRGRRSGTFPSKKCQKYKSSIISASGRPTANLNPFLESSLCAEYSSDNAGLAVPLKSNLEKSYNVSYSLCWILSPEITVKSPWSKKRISSVTKVLKASRIQWLKRLRMLRRRCNSVGTFFLSYKKRWKIQKFKYLCLQASYRKSKPLFGILVSRVFQSW